MRLIKPVLSFVLIFAVLACTVTALAEGLDDGIFVDLSDEPIYEERLPDTYIVRGDKGERTAVGASFTPRLKAPAKTSKYYYSDKNVFYKYGWGMPNCTAYAWGRAYEILGKEPSLSVYSAYLWYDYNKDNKIYSYGQTPKLGAVACWVYASGYSGHVAVVEKIEGNTVTYSNSAWDGEEFYLTTSPKDDPTDGNDYWIFQGYIYIGNYESAESTADKPSAVSGDVYRITSDDGVNLRRAAGTGGEIIGAIGYGQDVTVTKTAKKNGYTWGYTTYNGKSGWFVLDFAKLIYKKTVQSAPAPAAEATKATETAVKATEATKATEAAVKATEAMEPTEAPKPSVPERILLMGDVDDDGYISIFDATYIQKVIAELIMPTEYIVTVGDYDGDSVFSILDGTRIQLDLVNDKI